MFFSREVSSKTRSTSSIWSPRSDHRAQSVISTPARGPEMSRAPRALVASPVISGISTTGGVPSQRAQSQSSPHVVQPRQTRSFTPPGVVVPAWAWLPSAIASKVQNPVLKALPTPNRSRSLQRPPLRVIQVSQVTRSSLKTNVTNVGQSLRACGLRSKKLNVPVVCIPLSIPLSLSKVWHVPSISIRNRGPPLRATLSGPMPTAWHAQQMRWNEVDGPQLYGCAGSVGFPQIGLRCI